MVSSEFCSEAIPSLSQGVFLVQVCLEEVADKSSKFFLSKSKALNKLFLVDFKKQNVMDLQ